MWRTSIVFVVIAALGLCSVAMADEKYSFHEKIDVGRVLHYQSTLESHSNLATTQNHQSTVDQSQTKQVLNLTETVLAAEDGSATKAKIDVGADSYDTTTPAPGQAEQKTSCSLAGHSMVLRRQADGTVSNDFVGKPDPTDLNSVNNCLNPDEDLFPDTAVAVGDSWDISAKLSKHSGLGPNDQLMSKCRLDWVKQMGGKQIAHMTFSTATISHYDGNVENDAECTGTMLVDVAACEIVESHFDEKDTYSTAKGEPIQQTGTVEYSGESADVDNVLTTQP
jgi:hypothetical protein